VWANVSGNLRIVHGLQLIPDRLVAEGPLLDCRFLCRRRVGEPQGICILGIDNGTCSPISSPCSPPPRDRMFLPTLPVGRVPRTRCGFSMTSFPALRFFH